jgi:H+/Cl- antiporter ClcA
MITFTSLLYGIIGLFLLISSRRHWYKLLRWCGSAISTLYHHPNLWPAICVFLLGMALSIIAFGPYFVFRVMA